MLIKPLLLISMEKAVNLFLQLSENAEQVLAPLVGKVISITVQPFNETVYLCPTAQGIQVLDYAAKSPDTAISGSAFDLGLMGMSAKPMRSIFAGKVSITGDMHVGNQLQRLFSKLDFNIAAKLSPLVGEQSAQQVETLIHSAKQWQTDSLETLKLNTSELLQEETRDLPAPAEAEQFFAEIDELRHDFDRLMARVQRLQSNIPSRNST